MKALSSISLIVALSVAFLSGCTTQGGSSAAYSVGPGSSSKAAAAVSRNSGLSVIVPIFNPGIPEDQDVYEDKNIWPELRRAEANRFAVHLKDALENTKSFNGVRVAPSSVATGHLFVEGEILKSNGEDVKVEVTVTDISGKRVMSKVYSHRVKEYSLDDPRMVGKDLYEPLFEEVAEDIQGRVERLSDRSIYMIRQIEAVRYGEAFSPDYFSQFIDVSRSGKVKLVSAPAQGDPMVDRIDVIRVKDQMFLDGVQADYLTFKQEMDDDYYSWQRQAYLESKAAREAQAKATAQKVFGALALVGGAIAMGSSNPNTTSQVYGGAAVMAAGAVAIGAGMENSKQADMHRESLNELGKSLNIELAPRVMKLEDQEVALEGTLEEQYTAWRSFLKDFYEFEATPDVAL